MKNNDDYNNLSKFWDEQFQISDEDEQKMIESINSDEDWKDLSPSQKLFDVITTLGGCKNVLDYGCGYGWASIIVAKSGDCFVKGVDVTPNGVKLGKIYQKAFKLENKIDFEFIDTNWLEKEPAEKYDGFFCSNVLDVIPKDMALKIIKETARIVTKDAKVIYSFNYCPKAEDMQKRGAVVEGNNIYINGVLRLVCYSDDELKEMFSNYFEVVSLDYFSWAGEEKETRRLFVLKKK